MYELPRTIPDVKMLLELAPEELGSTILFLLKKRNEAKFHTGNLRKNCGGISRPPCRNIRGRTKRNKPCSVGSVGVAPGAGTYRSGHGERAVRMARAEPPRARWKAQRISKALRLTVRSFAVL
jgi:hypothetical protein